MPTKTQCACFFDPGLDQRGLEGGTCPLCGLPYDFMFKPDRMPQAIGDMNVVEGISRGFYSAVFRALDVELDIHYAVKVIPVEFYEPGVFKQDGKDFLEEVRTHIRLSDQSMVAKYEGRGREWVNFGDRAVECYWIKMEYVDGPSLKQVIEKGPENVHQIAQIAYDLLDLLDALDAEGIHHNDLHQKNVKVTKPVRGRLQAIDSGTQVKVLDWGSVADETRTNVDSKCGDVRQVASHLHDLLRSFFDAGMPNAGPQDVRFCDRLQRLAVSYLGQDSQHHPRPKDMMEAIKHAYLLAASGPVSDAPLGSIASHWNAKTLSPWLVPALFHDPTGTWLDEVSGAGPTVLTGMRGCGKTMLLRSLEWLARVQPRKRPGGGSESSPEVHQRLEGEPYLGLFVTCQELSSSADARHTPLRMLLISYALEALEALDYCSVLDLGQPNHLALDSFLGLLHELVPWFEIPESPAIHFAIKNLRKAWGAADASEHKDLDVTAFIRLAEGIRSLTPVWQNKRLLFLLDDLSRRYFVLDDALRLMATLLYQDASFAFKITTETQTLDFRTPGGQSAMDNRDYRVFDLGFHVLENLKNGGAVPFIDEVLHRRSLAATSDVFRKPPSYTLGRQPRDRIAARIYDETRSGPKARDVYWGINALVGVCVGDIGDVILLYEQILRASEEAGYVDRVPPEIQHQQMIRFSNGKLHGLAKDLWLEKHAITFARAAHDELKMTKNVPNWRQLSEVRFSIEPSADPADVDRCLAYIDRLVEAGVFVLGGVAARSRNADGQTKIQRRLVYRKLLGLNALIPLTMRHRVELPFDRLLEWLAEPTPRLIREGAVDASADSTGDDDGNLEVPYPEEKTRVKPAPRQESLFSQPPDDPDELLGFKLFSTKLDSLGQVPWEKTHLISAFGFEDRSLGIWQALASAGVAPAGVTMLQYEDPGHEDEIRRIIEESEIPYGTRQVADHPPMALARSLIDSIGDNSIVIDVTALTKPLIYALVKDALVRRRQLLVLHACAGVYEPKDDELEPVSKLLSRRPFANALAALRERVSGELGPFKPMLIDEPVADPGQQSVLAAFVPLKFERVEALIEEMRPEKVVAIAVTHSSGDKARRSRISRFLADHFSADSGVAYSAPAMDELDTYRLLVSNYREWALDATYNFAVALSGSKMQAVATAMLGSVAPLAAVYYSKPSGYLHAQYTSGIDLNAVHIRRIERRRLDSPVQEDDRCSREA